FHSVQMDLGGKRELLPDYNLSPAGVLRSGRYHPRRRRGFNRTTIRRPAPARTSSISNAPPRAARRIVRNPAELRKYESREAGPITQLFPFPLTLPFPAPLRSSSRPAGNRG